ncbi:hypothetical protein [uncultured Mucilaginibacter sp.]|uniref:hypothetical protein n=1 Tax=uncultured Mucilaginibacter sp. TaxID=797541 RepID=UPI0025FEC51D|nr:hypothetical protein [uncultured Mucilaginibacter sp.]
MKLRLAFPYLLHRFTSKNRHGLHSPFVYKLLDEVIYDRSPKKAYANLKNITKILPADGNRKNSLRVNQLLYRLVQFLQPANLGIATNVNNVTVQYLQLAAPKARLINCDQTPNPPGAPPCFVWDAHSVVIHAETLQPNTVIILTNIHIDAAANITWQLLKANPNTTVSIDLFWIGLAFNRPGQVKEHFKLRF